MRGLNKITLHSVHIILSWFFSQYSYPNILKTNWNLSVKVQIHELVEPSWKIWVLACSAEQK